VTDDVGKAIHEILNFYSNYHSSRLVGGRLVVRVRRAPSFEELEGLNTDFKDIVTRGGIEVRPPGPQPAGEALQLSAVVFRFDGRKRARLRQLIDRLNSLVPDASSPPREASPQEVVSIGTSAEKASAED
jgi:hypothetical protein